MGLSESENISLIYLGTRGGGARLLRDLSIKWNSENRLGSIFVRQDCEFLSELKGDVHQFRLPYSRLLLLTPLYRRKFANSFIPLLQKGSSNNLLFIMSHPWNPYLLKRLNKSRIQTISIIHDDRPHLGEIWPTRRHLLKEYKYADLVVFLSHHVAKSFNGKIGNLILSLDALPLVETTPKIQRILVPGRIRKYKGLTSVFEHLMYVPTDYELVIAGQGKFKFRQTSERKIQLQNRWLSANDFETLIMESSHVLLPYLEATQSGVISIAKLYNCRILINDVGGLIEQLEYYQNWSLIPKNPQDILNVLDNYAGISHMSIGSKNSIFDLPKIISSSLR
jgi:hypothetical protein